MKTPKSLIDQLKQLVLLAVSPLTADYAPTTARQTADQILTSPQPVLAASSAVPGRQTAVGARFVAANRCQIRRGSRSYCRSGSYTAHSVRLQPAPGTSTVGNRSTAVLRPPTPVVVRLHFASMTLVVAYWHQRSAGREFNRGVHGTRDHEGHLGTTCRSCP